MHVLFLSGPITLYCLHIRVLTPLFSYAHHSDWKETNLSLVSFILSKTCILWRHQRVYSASVNGQKEPFSKHFSWYLFNFAFSNFQNFWSLVWKMINSVLKGNISRNCFPCDRAGSVLGVLKKFTCKIFWALKMAIFNKEDIRDWKHFWVVLTFGVCWQNWPFGDLEIFTCNVFYDT